MRTKNIMSTVLMGLALVGTAAGTSAFAEKFADQIWHFDSDNPSDITDASKWTLVDPNREGCQEQTADLPCALPTPESVNTNSALQSYFSSHYSNNASLIKADSPQQRVAP